MNDQPMLPNFFRLLLLHGYIRSKALHADCGWTLCIFTGAYAWFRERSFDVVFSEGLLFALVEQSALAVGLQYNNGDHKNLYFRFVQACMLI